jgi:cytochrome oxidase assembly protein ShyY1
VYSFLLTPRWFRLIAAALVVGAGCVALGFWQVDRLGTRHERNDLIRRHLSGAPAPLRDVARVGRDLPKSEEWRSVQATGRYDVRHELLVRNRVLEGKAGYHVVTPLVTADGPALLVDRGWVPTGQSATSRPDVPPPPSGVVTVIARLRPSEPPAGDAAAPQGQVRRIDVAHIAELLPYDVYGGYGQLVRQRPAAAQAPRLLPAPEPSEGPHLAYAFQWFVFATIAVVGLGFLARREAREGDARPPAHVGSTPRR